MVGPAVHFEREARLGERDVDDRDHPIALPHRMVGHPSANAGTTQQAMQQALGLGGRAVAAVCRDQSKHAVALPAGQRAQPIENVLRRDPALLEGAVGEAVRLVSG